MADTGEVEFASDEGYEPITELLQVTSGATDIVRVELLVGDTDQYNFPAKRVNLDTVVFTDDAPPPLPPAPQISFYTPGEGRRYDDPRDIDVSGNVWAPSGVARFCVTANAESIPANCPDAGALSSNGTFTGMRPRGDLHPGENTLTVWVEDRNARIVSATRHVVVSAVDVRPSNIEVIQAVQTDLPKVEPLSFEGPHSAVYNGVRLAAGKATFVRVWAEARFDDQVRALEGIRMQLAGFRGGVSLGDPVSALSGPTRLDPAGSVPSDVTLARRADPALSWVFALPSNWLSGEISLEAIFNPPGFADNTVSECAGCDANNRLRLDGVAFTPMRTVTITPVEEVWRDGSGALMRPLGVQLAFDAVRATSPFPLNIRPYQAQIDITEINNRPSHNDGRGNDGDEKNSAAYDKVSEWDQNAPGFQRQGLIVGVNTGVARGLAGPVFFCCEPPRIDSIAVTESNRPLTSMAHETYHLIGFKHAGYGCDGAGGTLGVHAETWPVDDRGTMQSIGYDVRPAAFRTGPLRIYGLQTPAGEAATNYDFMSYCADPDGDPNSWISARNWTKAVNDNDVRRRAAVGPPRAVAASARAAQTTPTGPRTKALQVMAVETGGETLLRTEAVTGRTSRSAAGGSAEIVVRDGDGDRVSRTRVEPVLSHSNRGGDVRVVSATVPARGGASVEVRRDGKLLERARRPRGRLRVKVLTPRRGARIGSTGTVDVRFRVRGPRAGRRTTILFSPNGRTRFRPVAGGVTGSRWRVPVELLERGTRARFRVRVTNGWQTAAGRSAPFSVAGPAPAVRIAEPAGPIRVLADGTLSLRGEAWGDAGRSLRGRALTWFAGRRVLGHGRTLRVDGLPRGTRRLRLVARTPDGRSSAASVPVRLVAGR